MNMLTSGKRTKQSTKKTISTVKTIVVSGILMLTLSSCDVLRESDTDSGIGGKGVAHRELQPKIGRGSPSAWTTKTCAVVEGRTQWKWIPEPTDGAGEDDAADPYIFQIDKPNEWQSKGKLGDVLITLLPLSSCAIDSKTTIAYTTKDWLCVDDYVRVNDSDCLIKAIKEL
tara:strand:+ start:43 stop:555 length:513 start_codon:yes stop_codon:yes gene_type:complete